MIDAYNLAGTLDSLTLLDETVGTEKHDTDLASLEVHAHALDARGEPRNGLDGGAELILKCMNVLDKLLSLDVGHTVHTGDTITMREKFVSETIRRRTSSQRVSGGSRVP